MRFAPDRVWSLQWFTEVAFPLLLILYPTMSCSTIEHASFSRGSTPVPSPNPPLLPNERDDVGLCRFTIDWCSSSISQRDTITGGRPDCTTYQTLCHRTQLSAPFTLFILFIFLPFKFNFITLIPFKKNTNDLIRWMSSNGANCY